MRILFALSGLHRIDRGAEMAFTSVANELAKRGHAVTLAGSGQERQDTRYRFVHITSSERKNFERYPRGPLFRDETAYEDLSFASRLLRWYKPIDYDVTLTCSYPFTNWVLRRPVRDGRRPPHVFVTQNGDWPARAKNAEYRFFGCDGLICINPDFYNGNKDRWRSCLIPNGADTHRFSSATSNRKKFTLPEDKKVILMVSALIRSKRVSEAIEAISLVPDAHLVVAGDGPERGSVHTLASEKLKGRFTNLVLTPQDIPTLYKSVDVFLHMSLTESFGNVFVEALAAGLPIVGHETPRLRWIVGSNATLIDTQDIQMLRQTLSNLEPATPQQRTSFEVAATRFDWSTIAGEYESFLEQVVEKPL